MATEIIVGLGAIKTAFDLAKGLKEIDDATKRNAAIIDLQQTILTAQQAQMELLSEVSELKDKLKAIDDNRKKLDRYEMIDVRGSGEFAYRLKADEANGQPQHFVCPTCYEKGKIATLHAGGSSDGQDHYTCHACDKHLTFGRFISRPQSSHYSDF